MAESPEDTINLRALAWVALGILVVLGLVGAGAALLWSHALPGDESEQPNAMPDLQIAGPMLDIAPQIDKEAYFAEKQKQLTSTEWIDRRTGIARIPIDIAMQILAHRQANAATPESARKGASRP